MRMRATMALVGLLAVSPLSAQAAKPDALLDHLIGNWVLTGRMDGKQVVHDVSFTWVLGGEYVQMHEVSREQKATGAPAYEAVVYLVHDPHTHEYAAMWMDNTDYNAFYPVGVGHGHAAADSIPFLFTYSATSRFHTTFVYDRTADRWAWHMDNDDNGTLTPFARVTLDRRRD